MSAARLAVGDRLPDTAMTPSALQLFRYSAITWNTHRIHYDPAWAAHEGHAGVLVHSHLHAANALRAVTTHLGPDWRIARVGYRVVRPASAGTTLTVIATVTAVDGDRIELSLREVDSTGTACLEGTAVAVRRGVAA